MTVQDATIDPTLLGSAPSNQQFLGVPERWSPSTLQESSSSSPLTLPDLTVLTSHDPAPLSEQSTETSSTNRSTKSSRKKPIPRKGHTKSRRGCFNCKRRKIKCQENLPACHHCTKAGLICDYPKTPAYLQQTRDNDPKTTDDTDEDGFSTALTLTDASNMIGSCRSMINMSGTPGAFDLQDMRFFHHFLQHGYPHLPIGADEIWVTTLPAISHQYAYLTHAILALSASHLQALNNEDLAAAALTHRQHAFSTLNTAISHPPASRDEADARMATVIVLAMQAVHLDENWQEYLTLSRGCFLFGADKLLDDDRSAFCGFRNDRQAHIMRARFADSQGSPCNASLLDEAVAAVNRVGELCVLAYEKKYVELMLQTLRAAYSDPNQAYTHFCSLFVHPSLLPHASFTHFLAPSNPTGALLIALYLGVQHTMIPILLYEFRTQAPPRTHAPTRMNSWIGVIARTLGEEYRRYWEWSVSVVERPWHSLFEQGALEEFIAGWKDARLVNRTRVREEVRREGPKRGTGEILGILDKERIKGGFEEL